MDYSGMLPRPRGERQNVGKPGFPWRRRERNRDPICSDRCVPITGQRDDIRQRRPYLRIDGRQHTISLTKDISLVEHDLSGSVGKYDAGTCIDEKDTGSEATQRICECRVLRRVEVKHVSDQHCPADVRNDKAHTPARFIVDNPVTLVAKHPEQCRAGYRFIEHRRYQIHQALWVNPLLVKSRFQELAVRHEIRYCDRLPDISKVMACCGRVEVYIFFEIELPMVRVDAV